MPNTHSPQVQITPLKPVLIIGMAQKLPVLVRVQTPDGPPSEIAARKPYHLSLVIDHSGSMSGEPLREAVRCARHIVDRLDPTDQASLVIFDDRVKTLVGAQPVGDRKALHMALARIHEGGSTNPSWHRSRTSSSVRLELERIVCACSASMQAMSGVMFPYNLEYLIRSRAA